MTTPTPTAEDAAAASPSAVASTAKKPDTKKDAPVEETVTIAKSDLDALMNRLKRVEFAADKGHLARFDKANQEALTKVVRLRLMDDKIITSWSDMNKNIVEKNANGVWGEDQTTTLTFEDDTEQEVTYAIFARRYRQVTADVIAETTKGGELFFEVRLEDGKTLTINTKFIN